MMGSLVDYVILTKPKVVVLLQITAICSVIVHDMLDSGLDSGSAETMIVVLVGGFLTAGGANAINMWYDRDIDPRMTRTAGRPIPSGAVSASSALVFGVVISIAGVAWFLALSNQIAAFWSAFSILFYVFIYSIWLKRSTPQNIVIGGIAGSTPPLIGWAACLNGVSISTDSVLLAIKSLFDLGSMMPWFMFALIFLWTPPHFWALALYRSEEYADVGVPMMPNVKGPERTLKEMKIYSILLVVLSFGGPLSFGELDEGGDNYHLLGLTVVGLSFWYASTVWRIDISQQPDVNNRIPSAANSFFISLLYLALMFVVLVTASFGTIGAVMGALLAFTSIVRSEIRTSS